MGRSNLARSVEKQRRRSGFAGNATLRGRSAPPALQRMHAAAQVSPAVQNAITLQLKADTGIAQLGRKNKKRGKKAKPVKMSLGEFNASVGPSRREVYDDLGAAGTIASHEVRFSQDGCSLGFQNPFPDKDGTLITTVFEATDALRAGRLDPASTPPITITFYEGEIVSVDNRRLKAHKDAGVPIRYVKVDFPRLTSGQKAHFDGSTHDNLHVR